MKCGFIRALWGIYDHQGRRLYQRRTKIDDDIEMVQHCRYVPPCTVYVFGEENFEFLISKGFECKLVDKNPIAWDMDTEQFRHKLEVFKQAMLDFDQIVFLDWDLLPVCPLPNDFWEILGNKESIQAILRLYHRKKASWRSKDKRKVSCGSFMYIRDKAIPDGLIHTWENVLNRPWSEEVVTSRYIDDLSGGWQGVDYYWEHYEPDFFYLPEARVFSQKMLNTKKVCFRHFNRYEIDRELNAIRKGELRKWQI